LAPLAFRCKAAVTMMKKVILDNKGIAKAMKRLTCLNVASNLQSTNKCPHFFDHMPYTLTNTILQATWKEVLVLKNSIAGGLAPMEMGAFLDKTTQII